MANPIKILIVDDDPQICNLLSSSFSSQGYETTSAHDVFQALEQIDAERFDILLLDLMLPGPGGIDILKHIHERQIGTKVIVLTAHASLKSTIEALQLGAYDYVTKPFQIKALRSTVKRAVEKQRLEAKLAAIHDLSHEMTLSLNVNQVAEAVLDVVERVLEFDICDIALIDDEQGDLYMLTGRGIEQKDPGRLPLSSERGITVAAARSGEPLYVPDVREDSRYVEVRATTRSELVVPLKVKDHVAGVLNIESNEVNAFSPSDVQLVSTLAAQASVAIENARLFEQAQQKIEERKQAELALLQERNKVQKYLDIVGAIIVVLDNQGKITLVNRRGCKILGYREKELLGKNWFDTCLPVQNRKDVKAIFNKLMAEEIELVEHYENHVLTKAGETRLVAWNNTVLRNEANNIIGTQSSGRDITEYRQAENKIKQHNAQLTALNEIVQAINTTLDLQETLTLITDHSIQLLDVEATSVLLYDKANDDLWFAAASGAGASRVIGQRLALGQGIVGWTAQHGKPALVTDVSNDPRVFRGFDQEGVFTTRSLLCVPLQSKGQIIGVLEACNKIGGLFTQEDVWLLSSLAAPAVTAIENARLFEQVRAGREQLQALSRRLVDVQEATLSRVARELHDETGQALSAMLLSLSLLEKNADDPVAVITRVNELEGLVDRTLENLHRLSMNLRPASLDHLGLIPALEHYVELFGSQHGLTAQFETVGLGEERLPPAVETAFYRIVQEALTNVARHAQATRLDVLLERRGDQIVTIVEDNGVGFDTEAAIKSGRLGLFGMRERAEMLDGNLTIESAIGAGTTVLVEIPDVKRET